MIIYMPARHVLPACWQVVHLGHHTDPQALRWQRGHKSFIVRSQDEKDFYEDFARSWASSVFEVESWVRIQGFGGALFPSAVAEELRLEWPELRIWHERQHLSARKA